MTCYFFRCITQIYIYLSYKLFIFLNIIGKLFKIIHLRLKINFTIKRYKILFLFLIYVIMHVFILLIDIGKIMHIVE